MSAANLVEQALGLIGRGALAEAESVLRRAVAADPSNSSAWNNLAALLAHYAGHYADEGKLLARFETLYMTGWAPHDSQQKPLQPGSAKSSLAQALGTTEHRLKQR